MKKVVSLLLTFLMICSMIVPAAAVEDKRDIMVLFTGNVRCGVEDHIGYAGLAAYAKDAAASGYEVVLADGGDALSGGELGTSSRGESIVDLMNYAGYDFAVPGIHEFDYGMEQFRALAGRAKFDVLCCNFIDLVTGESVFKPYQMADYDGYKVAYIGIASPLTPGLAVPGTFQNAAGDAVYSFCGGNNGQNLYSAVQNAVNAARQAGADRIIAISHLGSDTAPYRTYDVIANTTGLDVMLDARSANAVIGEQVADKNNHSVLLSSPGEKMEYVSILKIDRDGGVITSLLTDSYEKKDADTVRYIDKLKENHSGLVAEEIGHTEFPLLLTDPKVSKKNIETAEMNLGDFVTDAIRSAAGADAAILPGGAFRAAIPAGKITRSMLMDVLPFGNKTCAVEVTGQQLLDALEYGVSRYPEASGAFLQVSGLTFDLHSEVPSGVVRNADGNFVRVDGRYRVQNVKIGGRELKPDQKYSLASVEPLLLNGADGFSMFAGSRVLYRDGKADYQVLADYLEGPLDGAVSRSYRDAAGRISVVTNDADHFEDLPIGGWSYEAIVEMIRKGIMGGVGPLFRPQEIVTRAMMVQMIYNAEKSLPNADLSVSTVVSFSDVPADAWYGDAVKWAASHEIVVGTDGKFRPDDFVTRQEMAVMLYRYAKYRGQNISVRPGIRFPSFSFRLDFKDGELVADWAVDAMGFCSMHGIIRGTIGGFLNPGAFCTRQEAAVMLDRFLSLK